MRRNLAQREGGGRQGGLLRVCLALLALAPRATGRLAVVAALSAAAHIALAVTPTTGGVHAHGVVGSRFFPATLAVDDPFVADELALPTISTLRQRAMGEEPAMRETEISIEYVKRITPNFALSLGADYRILSPRGLGTRTGWGNLELGAKYQFLALPEAELIASVGLGFELGGTGARRVEADRFSTAIPALFFGKGFGDLPESLPWLRPLAITGTLGIAAPLRSTSTRTVSDPDNGGALFLERERNPTTLRWGFTVQYSLPYLQSNVRDLDLGPVLGRMIPLVEFAFESPVGGRAGGRTIGTVNPGVIWVGRQMQLGLEMVVPVNAQSGRGVGVIAQVHFYLDDLFPRSLGRPVFGN
jgi:hypothetical protein